MDAVNAGKDVYCEKPMSHNPADGLEMVAAAKKTDRIVQIGAQRTSSVLCAKAKELIDKGAIGDLNLIEATSAATIPPARGSIRLRPIFRRKIWTGIHGSAPRPRSRLIRWPLRAGAAGRNMARVSPAICWST